MHNNPPYIIVLNPRDNVAVALVALKAGQDLGVEGLIPAGDIPAGHKLARQEIPAGQPVLKYGQVIGFAKEDIQPGAQVHVHNLEFKSFEREYVAGSQAVKTDILPPDQQDSFMGYAREDGSAGTRNYLGVITTVNCTASVARFIAESISKEELAKYPNVDGIVPISHGSGCCVTGEGRELLERSLAGMAHQSNFAGVLYVGLGCETVLVNQLCQRTGLIGTPRLRGLNTQDIGGTRAMVEAGRDILRAMLEQANQIERSPQPVSKLKLGLECGGSDAYSGITANPALGAAADLIVKNGGTVILAETPEIYGAEHLLVQRAVSQKVADKLLSRIKWWENYTKQNLASINNNPTPGNKAGGISTILEKSLGAVAKAGSSNLNEVYLYGEKVEKTGLVFMDTPGYDAASITGMVAGGANVVCFTTGRGTVYGTKPTPVIKLASNSPMYQRLEGDMDVDCGPVLGGGMDIPAMGRRIYEKILATASGELTKSEALGYGDLEFVPWHIGVVM